MTPPPSPPSSPPAPSAVSTLSAVSAVLARFSSEVTDFLGSGVVDQQEGTTVASHPAPAPSSAASPSAAPDPQLADAYLAQVLRLHLRAQAALSRDGDPEDLAISTSGGLLLARPLPNTPYLWTLLTGPSANLSLTRALMRRFLPQLLDALPKA